MNDTPTSSPRQKANKNKIRPKLKPIISPDEDDDEGLGYGEWAPSPLKPRPEILETDCSSGEDEKKDEGITHDLVSVGLSRKIKKIRPKLQPVSIARSRPTESQCSFDNKLQLSENGTYSDKEKSSDNKALNNGVRTLEAANSNSEIISNESLRWLRAKVWKGLVVLLCIVIACEVSSIAIITKVRLSHVELSISDKEPFIALVQETGENDKVSNMELVELKEEEADLTMDILLSSEETVLTVTLVNDEQYDTKDESQGELESQLNVELNLVKLEEDATDDGKQPEIESLSPLRENFESNDDEQPAAKIKAHSFDTDTQFEIVSLSPSDEVSDGFAEESQDNEHPDIVETSDCSKLEADENFSPLEEVTQSDAKSGLDPSRDEVIGEESDTNELADTDLVDVVVEDSDNGIHDLMTPSEEYESKSSASMEEVLVSDKQPVANNIHDASTPSKEPEPLENEPAKTELVEEKTKSEDVPEGSPSLDDGSDHGDNNYHEEENEHELQQEPPPRYTTETKREFLDTLDKFEDTFDSYDVIDALIGHVVFAVPKLLLKRILGAAMKVKGGFSKKEKKQ